MRTTLTALEERLKHEMPTVAWHCRSLHNAFIPGTDIPEQIEITAHNQGGAAAGRPWRVRGKMLQRWGTEATAKLIAKNFPVTRPRRIGPSWDKLAEI